MSIDAEIARFADCGVLPWDITTPVATYGIGRIRFSWSRGRPAGQELPAAVRALLLRYDEDEPARLAFRTDGGWHTVNGAAAEDTFLSICQTVREAGPLEQEVCGPALVLCASREHEAETLVLFERLGASMAWLASPYDDEVTLWYHSGRFGESTARRIISHLLRLHEQLLASPASSVADPCYLSEDEAGELLRNDTSRVHRLCSVTGLLRERARATPFHLAYRFEEKTIDFAALDKWSGDLAASLAEHGLCSGEAVAVFVERSHLSALALLSIWRAGGCYLPVDVDFPPDYIAHILTENDVRVAIADAANHDRLLAVRPQLIAILADGDLPAPAASDACISPEQPAAILYTSGSTGLPKGVVHTHRGLLNRLAWFYETYPCAPGDRLLQRTSITFIPSITELLGSVITGCPTIVVPRSAARDPAALAELIRREEATHVGMVPSLLEAMLHDEGRVSCLAGLRQVVTAGEVVSEALWRKLRRYCPDIRLVNDYGCTEVNGVLAAELTCWEGERRILPAGWPISNVQAYVLDPRQRPQPAGLIGDLYIGGMALGPGYVKRPEENARRFVEVDFGNGRPTRLYRTGDRARRLADGSIEVLGRGDNVVKVRGNRVELEGVENVLRQHAGIEDCAAAACDSGQLVAYVMAGTALSAAQLRAHLERYLPAYMVPSRFVSVTSLPRTANGKLNRAAMRRSPPAGMQLPSRLATSGGDLPASGAQIDAHNPGDGCDAGAGHPSQDECLQVIRESLEFVVGRGDAAFDPLADFRDCGLDSIAVVPFVDALCRRIECRLTPSQLFDFATPLRLAAHLAHAERQIVARSAVERTDEIAIVGLAGRMPGAKTLDQFWHNLLDAQCAVSEVPPERWTWSDYYAEGDPRPGFSYSKWGAFLDDIDVFDPLFFGISVREARAMDPQQRLMLQTCWHALENAGCSETTLVGERVGVFIGVRPGDYLERLQRSGMTPDAYTLLGNDSAILAARIAYYLDLKGPVISVDTACSSSLVALHLACQAIRRGECDMALAGGVSLMTTPTQHIINAQAGMLSPTGLCRSFGDRADGFVQGEGVGAVVLKPLARAQADGDRILAVIRSSVVNQDGRTNGITAPSGASQRALLQEAWQGSRIDPAALGYFEAHGTGTVLGDPIEAHAIAEALSLPTGCRFAVGSVKSNIGHLIAAAGIAGLIKLIYTLQDGRIAPSLHAEPANPHIDFEQLGLYVPGQAMDWPTRATPRRAGISSFGFGGTNCHVVLEEPPKPQAVEMPAGRHYLIPLAAKTSQSLAETARHWAEWLDGRGEICVADVAYTAVRRINAFPYRAAVVCDTSDSLSAALHALARDGTHSALLRGEGPGRWQTQQMLGRYAQKMIEEAEAGVAEREALLALAALYVDGFVPEWRRLAVRGTLLPLPGYAFARERFWVEWRDGTEHKTAYARETLGHVKRLQAVVERSGESPGWRFINSFDGSEYVFREHLIGGKPVLPGAAQLALLAGAMRRGAHRPVGCLRQVTWLAPCAIEDKGIPVLHIQVNARAEGDGADFHIGSAVGDGERTLHAKGALSWTSSVLLPSRAITFAPVLLRCRQKLDPAQHYLAMEAAGVHYGVRFRAMRSYRHGGDEAIAWLEFAGLGEGPDFHPEQLDAILQCVAPLTGSGTMMLPFSIGKLQWWGALPNRFAVYVNRQARVAGDTCSFDLVVADGDGRIVMQIRDFVVRQARRQLAAADNAAHGVALFRPHWVRAALEDLDGEVGELLLIGASEDVNLLADALPLARVLRITRGSDSPDSPENEATWARWLSEHAADTIVFQFTKEPMPGLNFRILFAFARAASTHLSECLPRVLLVVPETPEPELAALGGFMLAWASEFSRLRWRLLRADETASNLAAIISSEARDLADMESVSYAEVAYRDGRWQRGWLPFACDANAKVVLPEDGVFLVAGGLGGIGRVLALHLARRGGRLVLLGRSPKNEACAEFVAKLRELGSESCYLQADIGDEPSLALALKAARRRFGRIDGVFHCAGVIRDALLLKKCAQDVEAVFRAKIDGARLLDRLTADDELACFVLFSSISAVTGTLGQTDYAYANRYLDEFAVWRGAMAVQGKRNGRTLSVDWPLLADGGMQPPDAVKDLLYRSLGMAAMPESVVCELIDRLLCNSVPHAAAVYGDAARIRAYFSEHFAPPASDHIPVFHSGNFQ